MKGLIIAIQFLTRLPAPCVEVSKADFANSMRWFPLVGLILGGLIAGAGWAFHRFDSWAGALAGLAVWVLATGALHLDGLGDMADASGAAHSAHGDRERLLAVLSDPHVGSFGATAIALQLIAKLVLLHAALDRGLESALVLVPFAARIAPLVWARSMEPLHEGLGAVFRSAIRPVHLAIWALAFLAAACLVPALLVAIPAVWLWRVWVMRHIGGISGDGHGAGIELTETALLLALIVGAGL